LDEHLRRTSAFGRFSNSLALLATAAAGLNREAAASRLVERSFVLEDPTAPLWPYHLHQTVRSAPDQHRSMTYLG